MKTKVKPKRKAGFPSAEETQRLIEAATKQPGVAELLRVYQTWQKFERMSDMHGRLAAARQIIWASNSSGPLPFERA